MLCPANGAGTNRQRQCPTITSLFIVLTSIVASPPGAKTERRQSEGTLCTIRGAAPHPFLDAKIVRNSDIVNFFERKESLLPLFGQRGSLFWAKRLFLATSGVIPIVAKTLSCGPRFGRNIEKIELFHRLSSSYLVIVVQNILYQINAIIMPILNNKSVFIDVIL